MKYPDLPTCHSNPIRPLEWMQLEGLRRCNFCHSIHPEDLVRVVELEGAKLGGADWKYSWPHKFYVYAAPTTGQIASRQSLGAAEPFHGALIAKWYNEHCLDRGYDDEARTKVFALLKAEANIEFSIQGDQLKYRAPSFGYQA